MAGKHPRVEERPGTHASAQREERASQRADLRFEHPTSEGSSDDTRLTLTEVEARHITRVLQEEEGVIDRAAKRLGITRNTLYYKVRKHRIALRKDSKPVFE